MNYKLISSYFVIFLLALSLQAGRVVNSRKIPTANDFLSEGAGPRYANQESLNVELANILTSTKDRDAIEVDRVITDTVSSNPVIDSISGALVVASGAGGVAIDTISETIVADSMKISSAGSYIQKVVVSADSIQFVIGDSTYSIAVTNTYVTP